MTTTTVVVLLSGGMLLVGLSDEIVRLLTAWMRHRAEIRKEEHQTRRIEALARMDEPARSRLLETMPDWLDREDPDDVEAWKKARAETLKHRTPE